MLNLNTPNKQWNMYLNTLSSISGDDLTIKPDTRRNLLLEVSGNNNIFIKKGDVSYNLSNLSNLITGDISFSNVDVSNNLNPLTNNNSSLGLPSKLWGNTYIRDISVTNMSVSGTISNFREIIPQIANNTTLGTNTNIWQRAFIRDLSGITSINGTNWPIIGPPGPGGQNGTNGINGTPGTPGQGPTGPTGPTGPELRVNINTTLTDISNFSLTTKSRIYQEISGGINDLSWTSVNGYYGLAKDAYPSLNPLSSGVKAVQTWTTKVIENCDWTCICWSPKLCLFAAVAKHGNNRVMISNNGINWTFIYIPFTLLPSSWEYICWSPQLEIFVAVAYYGDNRIMTSSNGTQWNIITGSNVIGEWHVICWSAELRLFVALSWSASIITSSDGTIWTPRTGYGKLWKGISWAPELSLFVAVAEGSGVMTSNNGINWNLITSAIPLTVIQDVCWSPELGIFVAVAYGGTFRVMTSNNGINWTSTTQGVASYDWYAVSWSPELKVFVAVGYYGEAMYSNNGINWNFVTVPNTPLYMPTICWSPELGIFVGVGNGKLMTSSLKGRPPTSYNVFDSSFNRIDENGKWDFSNINVTTLTMSNGPPISSDDRLKHNEVVINNGLDVIDKLTPKFYQKTQVLLDASYNGDLTGYAWTLEAGLIAQELLKINDLSYVVSGGDYYEQTYKYITQTNDLSNSYYDLINAYYDLSTNYEIINNLIAQAYNVNYNSIFVYGLAAIKELHTKVKAQEAMLLNQKNIISSLLARIQVLQK